MNRVVKYSLVAVVLCLSQACATWEAGDGVSAYEDKKQGFSYVQESGWYRSPYKVGGSLTLTKDGPDLQYVAIGRRKHKKAFAQIEKDSSPTALPQELAEDYLANMKAQLGLDVVEVLSSQPAMVGGIPGFQLDLRFKTEEGLRYRNLVRGAANADGLYIVEFRAPVIHYYDRDVEGFNKMLSSFKIAIPST